MDVYIKSFNRPFLLDRCLASLYKYAVNHHEIVVMDDGTPRIYIQQLQQKYPAVRFMFSDAAEDKATAISKGQNPKKIIPTTLWNQTIKNGSTYFLLLEDDMWLTAAIDLAVLEMDMSQERLSMVKMMWLENTKLISAAITKEKHDFYSTKPRLLTHNATFFKKLFIQNTMNVQGMARFLGFDWNDFLLPYYQIYIVAGGAYTKQYYAACWSDPQQTVNEWAQIYQLLKARKQINLKVGHTKTERVKASYKTTASSQNKEHLKEAFDVYQLNAFLNAAWYAGESYAVEDFQNDVPNSWLQAVLSKVDTSGGLYHSWEKWYQQFKETYEAIGCSIKNDD